MEVGGETFSGMGDMILLKVAYRLPETSCPTDQIPWAWGSVAIGRLNRL